MGPDGHVYVEDAAHRDVRVFTIAGAFLRSIGRLGRGPGEFQAIREFGWLGDTLWVTDQTLGRASLFPANGSPVLTMGFGEARTLPFAPPVLTPGGAIAQLRPVHPWDPEAAAPIVRFRSDWVVRDTLARLSAGHFYAMPRMSVGRNVALSEPFRDNALWDIDSEGRWLVVAHRAPATRPDSARFSVTTHDLKTGKSTTVTIPYQPVRIGTTIRDSVLKRYPGVPQNTLKETLFWPDFFPPLQFIVVARDGQVWIDRREASDTGFDSSVWTRFDSLGRVTAQVQIASDCVVVDADARYLLVVHRNPDGEKPPLIVYEITR
jgi:hypothetical protein